MASPKLPNGFFPLPLGSRKPKCRRALVLTETRLHGAATLSAPVPAGRKASSIVGSKPLGYAWRCRSAALFQKIAPMATSERTYTDAEIEERLKKELPHWYLEGGWIKRRYRTNSWK